MTDPRDIDDIDAAYAAAADAPSDRAGARRRRAAVLAAVRQVDAPGDQTAPVVQAPRPTPMSTARATRSSNWWGALAAACVVGLSSLLVLRVNDVSPVGEVAPPADQRAAAAPSTPERAAAEPERAPPRPELGGNSVGAPSGAIANPAAAPPPRMVQPPIAPMSARPKTQVEQAPPRIESSKSSVRSEASASPPPSPAAARDLIPLQTPPPPPDLRDATPPAPRSFPLRSGEESLPRPLPPPTEAGPATAAADAAAAMQAAPTPKQPPNDLRARRSTSDLAAAPGASPAAERSLGSSPAKAEARPAWRPNGLIAAVESGDLERIRRQLQSVSPDAEKDVDGRSALVHAVLRSNLPAVELLIAAGADSRLPDRQGKTAFDHGVAVGDAAILEALRQR